MISERCSALPQNALCRHDAVVVDYDRSVMQRSILEEDVVYQRNRNIGVHCDAAFDYELQIVFLHQYYQCAGLGFAHVQTSRNNRRRVDVVALATCREYARNEVQFLLTHSYHLQESSYFGLENDYQRDYAYTYYLTENRGEQLHVHRSDDNPEYVDDDDAGENVRARSYRVWRGRARKPDRLPEKYR